MKPTSKTLSWAFVIILLAVGIFTGLGVILMHKQPLVLQGQAEATEIRISGKLPGRIDTFFVQEGDWVHQGDTLVVINSPEVHAKYQQVNALEQVAVQQNKKIDAGTRSWLLHCNYGIKRRAILLSPRQLTTVFLLYIRTVSLLLKERMK